MITKTPTREIIRIIIITQIIIKTTVMITQDKNLLIYNQKTNKDEDSNEQNI